MKQIWKKIDGIGESKRDSRKQSGLKGESGHMVSAKVHSLRYKDEIWKTGQALGNFARERFGIKDMQAISREVVDSFIQEKIDQRVTYGTISNYVSHLSKLQVGLEAIEVKLPEHQHLYSREDLKEIREYAREHASKSIKGPRNYIAPEKIIGGIERYDVQLGARVQLELGLRAEEAIRIFPKQITKGENGSYFLTIQGKGGYFLTKELPRPLENDLRRYIAQNGALNVKYDAYLRNFKKAVEQSGEKWHGTHGLRHNFAQNRMREYQSEGMDRKEALRAVSEDMGHHRPEITETYLR
jgi:hypothetical protein